MSTTLIQRAGRLGGVAASVVAAAAALIVTYAVSSSQTYLATIIATGAVFAMAATGLDFVVGWLREVSVGQGAAMLVGAYCGQPFAENNPLLGIIVAGLGGLATGVVLGLPAIRVRGFALATYTLIFALGVQLFFASVSAFGGAVGKPVLTGDLLGIEMNTTNIAVLCVGLTLLGVLVHYLLRRSMVGLAWRSVGLNAQAAGSLSINPVAARLSAFGMAGLFAGVAGFLYAVISGFLAPDIFGFELSVQFLAMVVIGGRTHPLGGVFGAALFTVYQQVGPASSYSDAAIGVILLLAVWFAPKGVMWYADTIWLRTTRRTARDDTAQQPPPARDDSLVAAAPTKEKAS